MRYKYPVLWIQNINTASHVYQTKCYASLTQVINIYFIYLSNIYFIYLSNSIKLLDSYLSMKSVSKYFAEPLCVHFTFAGLSSIQDGSLDTLRQGLTKQLTGELDSSGDTNNIRKQSTMLLHSPVTFQQLHNRINIELYNRILILCIISRFIKYCTWNVVQFHLSDRFYLQNILFLFALTAWQILMLF